MDRAKLIKLRNSINNYLVKYDAASKLENLEVNIGTKVEGALQEVGTKIEGITKQFDSKFLPPVDVTPMVKVLKEIKTELEEDKEDRTDELIEAIAGIKVSFPETVNVGNFPPQKIPTAPSHVKTTLVADDTDLLQGIIDAISNLTIDAGEVVHDFSEANVAAGNTVVLATYTVPAAKVVIIGGVYGEGIDNGLFALHIDGVKQWQDRNAWTERGVNCSLQHAVATGEVIEVKVTNLANATRAFSGGFYGRQINP